jgi:hypothetical protein
MLLSILIAGGATLMKSDANIHVRLVLDLSDQLFAVSENGYRNFDDNGHLMFFGIVRDCAFRLRDAAEAKRKAPSGKGAE